MPLNDKFKERGLCRYAEDPELWWPNGTTGTEEEKITEAKRICSNCPVMTECLTFAIEQRQYFGIWGGTTEEERRDVRRRRLNRHRGRFVKKRVDTKEAVEVG